MLYHTAIFFLYQLNIRHVHGEIQCKMIFFCLFLVNSFKIIHYELSTCTCISITQEKTLNNIEGGGWWRELTRADGNRSPGLGQAQKVAELNRLMALLLL